MYSFNGKPFSDYGIISTKPSDSDLSISGCWDMPSRTGKTHHVWPDDIGLEPYVRADEIFFSGRDIVFRGHIQSASREGALVAVNKFISDIDSATTLAPLTCPWGTWNVYVKDAIAISYMSNGISAITITFREPVVTVPTYIPVGNGGIGIDGIAFEELGLVKLVTSDQFDRSAIKGAEQTVYGSEAWKVTKRTFREFNLKFAINEPSYASFISTVSIVHALFAKAGVRTLTLDDGSVREFFVKDGFSVSGLRRNGETTFAYLDVKISEIRLLENWNKFSDGGLVLVDKYGQPLAELIKMI